MLGDAGGQPGADEARAAELGEAEALFESIALGREAKDPAALAAARERFEHRDRASSKPVADPRPEDDAALPAKTLSLGGFPANQGSPRSACVDLEQPEAAPGTPMTKASSQSLSYASTQISSSTARGFRVLLTVGYLVGTTIALALLFLLIGLAAVDRLETSAMVALIFVALLIYLVSLGLLSLRRRRFDGPALS